jgi:hypothetical protein
METIMLNIKFAMFLALEGFVFAVIGAALIAGVAQIVRERSRREAESAADAYLPTRAW